LRTTKPRRYRRETLTNIEAKGLTAKHLRNPGRHPGRVDDDDVTLRNFTYGLFVQLGLAPVIDEVS
jgi:hypothetical protein